jgi:formate hydrogenlyase subunit 3/multisubunit Na+/H+ antiporter MnhD subunit
VEGFDWSRFSPTHWFADVREPIDHPAYAVLAAMLVVALFVSIFMLVISRDTMGGHRAKQRQLRRVATAVAWLAGIGLVILFFRWQPVPVFSKRIWFYSWIMAALGTAGFFAHDYRKRYPARLAAFEADQRRRQYMPKPARKAERSKSRRRR